MTVTKEHRSPGRQRARPKQTPLPGRGGTSATGRNIWWLFVVLQTATFAAYYPAWRGSMLWDDDFHLTPPALRSWSGLKAIWLHIGATPQFYPVVHSAFWLQYHLWGTDPLGYHLVNIALHATSAFLLAVVLTRLKVPGAVLATVVFALHPVQVESVAWMTELKNTLSGVCYFAALLAYLRFADERRFAPYLTSFAWFVLALLSKTVTATFPAALLVIFWWQRGRLEWRRDVMPLLPFLLVGVGGGILSAWFEHTLIGARGVAFNFTVMDRFLIAGRAVWFYLAKLAWPMHLTFIYPRWNIDAGSWPQYLYVVAAVAAPAALSLWRTRTRAPLAAALLFGGTLFPALGFVNVYPFRFSFVADHFQYLASAVVIALAAAGAARLADRFEIRGRSAVAAVATIAAVLGVLTWRQSTLYADAPTLYRATIVDNPDCWLAHNNLGELEMATPDGLPDAVAHFREALRTYPTYALARNNLGVALLRMGHVDEAINELNHAIADAPNDLSARSNVALALAERGRFDEAATEYEYILSVNPALAQTQVNLGLSLIRIGELSKAIPHLREAIRLEPDGPDAEGFHYALGGALAGVAQYDQAVAEYHAALQHDPAGDEAAIRSDLGEALYRSGHVTDAIAQLREAMRIDPTLATARANLERVMAGSRSPAR